LTARVAYDIVVVLPESGISCEVNTSSAIIRPPINGAGVTALLNFADIKRYIISKIVFKCND
jgi:hypothetical protein